MKKPFIMVLSSPSGGGKTTQEKLICERLGFVNSVSVTTRDKRPDEINNVHYRFVTRNVFEICIKTHSFVEYAEVHGNYYGTLTITILGAIESKSRLLLKIDIQGFRSVKKHPDQRLSAAVRGIFLMPPSLEELERRLRARNKIDKAPEEVIRRRLAAAPVEIAAANEFDHVITTHDQESTFDEIRKIVETHS